MKSDTRIGAAMEKGSREEYGRENEGSGVGGGQEVEKGRAEVEEKKEKLVAKILN